MDIKVLNRPAIVEETPELDREFRAARWVYHRLLDFELEHQALLDAAYPRLARVGKVLARLYKRDRWRERATGWAPADKPKLKAALEAERLALRKERNADPKWKELLGWPREKAGEKKARRKAGETEEEFAERQAKAYRTRREVHALAVYAERRCYWASFNAQKASVEQALKTVLKFRREGRSAKLRRPRWSEPGRICAAANNSGIGFEILERGKPYWIMRMRLHEGWVTFKAKFGRHHELPSEAYVREVELLRKRDGNRWLYSVSLTIRGSWPRADRGDLCVGIDTGHRSMKDGSIRAFTWYGQDGQQGEVRLPKECWEHIEMAQKIQQNIDKKFLARETGHRNRHVYRKHLLRLGVRTEDEAAWLAWETMQERRIARNNRRARNIRNEIYIAAARMLRSKGYSAMGIDVDGRNVQRLQTDEMTRRIVRQRRNLVAAYLIKTTCERFGLEDLEVVARKSTMECPGCGQLRETGAKLEVWCPACDTTCDQDYGAAYVLMRRAHDTARKAAEEAAE